MFDIETTIMVISLALIALIIAWLNCKLFKAKSYSKSWLISFAILYTLYQIGKILHP